MAGTGEFRTLGQSDFLEQHLVDLGLRSPVLRMTNNLDLRLRRHGRGLEVDEGMLLGGLSQVEPECPLTVTFDTYPQRSEATGPEITIPTKGVSEAVITLAPNLSAKDTGPGRASRRLNTALWTGLLALDVLAEDVLGYRKRQQQRGEPYSFKNLMRDTIWGGAVEGTAVLYNLEVEHIGLSAILTAGVVATSATALGRDISKRRVRNMTLEEFALHDHVKQGKAMAHEYPVLTYGYSLA